MAHEARRQIAVLSAGGVVTQETRLWDPDRGESRVMRTKEDAPDYRYLGDPDLPLLVIDEARLDDVTATLPELPAARRRRYEAAGVAAAAAALVDDPAATALFEGARGAAGDAPGRARALANWVLNEVLGLPDGALRVAPAALGRLVALVEDGAVAGRGGKELVRALVDAGPGIGADAVDALVDARGLRLQQGGDAEAKARAVVVDVLAKSPAQVAQVKGGKDKIKGFLVGQALKALGQGADPKLVQRLVDEELARG